MKTQKEQVLDAIAGCLGGTRRRCSRCSGAPQRIAFQHTGPGMAAHRSMIGATPVMAARV
ncbi:hypothetical protein E4O93_04635 [Diaphorobacter sp. DS2]|nr:hypothetical protein E4O93_04635 [Diaphorobacter sp. DS2]